MNGFGRALDTPAAVHAAQADRWRRMTPAEKAALVSGSSRLVRRLAEAGIAERYPLASARERFLRFAILHLGRDLAARAYPDAAQLDP